MKHILTTMVLMTFLFSGLLLGETMDDLVKRDGLYYKEFTDVPFTGKITGKKQGTIRNGEKEGPWVRYWYNGQLLSKGTYKDGEKEGPWVRYWDNGGIDYKGTFKDGKRDGPWISYHDNGQLDYKGTYKDGETEGPWVGYDDNGQLRSKGTYKDGEFTKDD
jgi:antitoxin component YwqK of YwqJK toxin-antitoxin module